MSVGVAPFLFVPGFGTYHKRIDVIAYYIGASREKTMKTIEAKNVIKTLNWIAQADGDDESVLEPKINQKGFYECVVHLPLIEKTVIGLGDTKLESIENTTKETSKLIDQYLEEHSETKLKNVFDSSRYILEEDDEGCLYIHFMKKEFTANGNLNNNRDY